METSLAAEQQFKSWPLSHSAARVVVVDSDDHGRPRWDSVACAARTNRSRARSSGSLGPTSGRYAGTQSAFWPSSTCYLCLILYHRGCLALTTATWSGSLATRGRWPLECSINVFGMPFRLSNYRQYYYRMKAVILDFKCRKSNFNDPFLLSSYLLYPYFYE